MDHLPVVCTLTPAERAEGDRLPALLRRAPERVELSTGYRFRFDGEPGALARIADAVERERQCCRFFRFQIAVEPDMGSITLDVSGHGEAKAFLAGLLA
jgi:hypothetical protein